MMRRIAFKALASLLLMLAVFLAVQVGQRQLEEKSEGKSSSMKRTHRWGEWDGDLAGLRPGKPTKFRQRPEKVEKPEEPPRLSVAKPVKGRPGFVYNPFDDGILDVRGIPAGTMAQYGMAPFFIVPKMGYIITPEESMKPMSAGGVMSVSCRPIYTEPRWDDGSPVMPGDMRASLKGAQ